MFTPEDRQQLREALIERARSDVGVVGAALLGSSSTGEEDRWSDIDLALSIEPDRMDAPLEGWTRLMYERYRAVHHFDVRWDRVLYRVFLLADTLQVDLSFWPSDDFVATGPSLRLLFGEPPARLAPPVASAEEVIGEAWLYLLHARSSIARGRGWQANYMLAGVRDRVMVLACRRHGLRDDDARGIDDLPASLLDAYLTMNPSGLGGDELRAALTGVTAALIKEAGQADPELTGRIKGTLEAIASG